jgi:hypothetical protein
LQFEECDCAVFKLLADDAFSFQPESVSVEANCSFQVINADSNYGNSRFHTRFSFKAHASIDWSRFSKICRMSEPIALGSAIISSMRTVWREVICSASWGSLGSISAPL